MMEKNADQEFQEVSNNDDDLSRGAPQIKLIIFDLIVVKITSFTFFLKFMKLISGLQKDIMNRPQ
jgi:hypothetical protein